MAIEAVKDFFSKYGVADRIREFDVSSATVELAAQALGCEPCRIAKTLSFSVDGRAVLIVAAGDAKIDNPKYKAQFGTKAKMLSPEDTLSLIGHAVGGVCPFAVKEGVKVNCEHRKTPDAAGLMARPPRSPPRAVKALPMAIERAVPS